MKRQFLSFTLLLALSTWIAQAATGKLEALEYPIRQVNRYKA